MYFSNNSSASMILKDVTTKAGRTVRRGIVEVAELQRVLDAAKANGDDRITFDQSVSAMSFKNGSQGYIAKLRSWKATPKQA